MAGFRTFVVGSVALVFCALAAGAQAQDIERRLYADPQALQKRKGYPTQDFGFDPSKFLCLNYTSGLSPNSTGRAATMMARIWILGFLDGYYKAADKLERND